MKRQINLLDVANNNEIRMPRVSYYIYIYSIPFFTHEKLMQN